MFNTSETAKREAHPANRKWLFLGMIALGLAAGCTGGPTVMEPDGPGSGARASWDLLQPNHDAVSADSAGVTPTGAFGGSLLGSGT